MTPSSKKTNLMAASRQWSERPADQRFWTLQELYDKTKKYAEESRVQSVSLSQCLAVPTPSGDLVLQGPNGSQAEFQNYSFGQLSSLCEAPAAYLRRMPAQVAADCLNVGLAEIPGTQSLMFHKNGGLHLRCVTSERYERIWNYEIAELALALEQSEGWVTPPARPCGLEGVPTRIANEFDVLKHSSHASLGVKVGDEISPAGLYASDRDCFIFQVNEDFAIDGGDGEQLYRGVFWSNSEVGDKRFKATMFLYETCCSNHICWNSKVLADIAIRHTGEARRAFSEAMMSIRDRMQLAESTDRNRIVAAKSYELGKTKEDIVSLVYGKNYGLSKKQCEDAYTLAERHESEHGGNPRSAWGYVAGLTRLSQGAYADERDRMDRSAGRILELAF